MAGTAVRAHRKHSSAPTAYLALFRGILIRDFATLIFLSHTFLIRPQPARLQRITDRAGTEAFGVLEKDAMRLRTLPLKKVIDNAARFPVRSVLDAMRYSGFFLLISK